MDTERVEGRDGHRLCIGDEWIQCEWRGGGMDTDCVEGMNGYRACRAEGWIQIVYRG